MLRQAKWCISAITLSLMITSAATVGAQETEPSHDDGEDISRAVEDEPDMVIESEQATDEGDDDAGIEQGLRHQSQLQVRAIPLGLSLLSDTAYRLALWDSESVLLSDTYIDSGVATALSPAYAWAGPYVEILPVAVLNLRVSAQYKGYFGTFGYLHVPDDGDWSPEALDRSEDEGLGESATGWRIEARATPQMLLGRVVITAETAVHRMEMDVENGYYEPYFDLFFAPEDTFLTTRPTIGYLIGSDLSKWFFLVGARWERIATRNSEVVRDTVGVVWNWQIPESLLATGSPSFAGFAGLHIDHPNRGDTEPYVGMQLLMEF